MWKLMGWVLSETTNDSKTLSIGGVGGIKVLLILTIYTYYVAMDLIVNGIFSKTTAWLIGLREVLNNWTVFVFTCPWFSQQHTVFQMFSNEQRTKKKIGLWKYNMTWDHDNSLQLNFHQINYGVYPDLGLLLMKYFTFNSLIRDGSTVSADSYDDVMMCRWWDDEILERC